MNVFDVLIIACLTAVFVGLWWAWPPLALIICGGCGVVLFSAIRLMTTHTGGKGSGDAE